MVHRKYLVRARAITLERDRRAVAERPPHALTAVMRSPIGHKSESRSLGETAFTPVARAKSLLFIVHRWVMRGTRRAAKY